MMRSIGRLLVLGAMFIYPVAIYFARGYLTPTQLLAGLLLLVATRLLIAAWIRMKNRVRDSALIALILIVALTIQLFLPDITLSYLRLYPMLISLLTCAIFFSSLFTRMSAVERIARTLDPDLPPQGVIYTRYVTWVWCGLLLLNSLVSLYTAVWASFEVWSLYNGLIVYLVFSGVFVYEYWVRTRPRRRWVTS